MALQDRLKNDSTVARLASQFVTLKVDLSDGEQATAWRAKFNDSINAIPFVYVVRSDGHVLYKRSGTPNPLPEFLTQHLSHTGRQLTPAQTDLLIKTVSEVEKLLKEDQVAAAIVKLAKAGGTGSFIEPAIQAEKLAADIAAKGKEAIAAAEKKLTDENEIAKLDGALDLVAAVRIYGRLPELKKRGAGSLAKQRKTPAIKELIRQAEAFDAAREAETKAGGAARAVAAFQKVVAQFPDTLIAKRAAERLAQLGPVVTIEAKRIEKTTTKEDAVATADAKKAANYLRLAKSFKKSNPDKAREYAQKVLDAAPDSDLAKQAKALLAEFDEGD